MAFTVIPNKILRRPYLIAVPSSLNTEPLPLSHARDYQELNARLKELLGHRTSSFTFLHLPIPHPGGIYDRATGQDHNLALVHLHRQSRTYR